MNLSGLSGIVLTGECQEYNDTEIGEIIELNGEDHVVVGKKGMYRVERGRWEVNIKTEKIRGKEVLEDRDTVEAPQWVRDVVYGKSSNERMRR